MSNWWKVCQVSRRYRRSFFSYREYLEGGPRTAEGGCPPPSGFSQIAKKTAARSAAKFAIAVQPTIWHISKKRWPDDPKGHASRSH